jgi:hypothetical protein
MKRSDKLFIAIVGAFYLSMLIRVSAPHVQPPPSQIPHQEAITLSAITTATTPWDFKSGALTAGTFTSEWTTDYGGRVRVASDGRRTIRFMHDWERQPVCIASAGMTSVTRQELKLSGSSGGSVEYRCFSY